MVFITDFDYIKKHKGENKAQKINDKIQEIEPEFDYQKMNNTKWYPAKWRILSLLVIQETFNWKAKQMYEMGRAAPI